MANEQRQRLLSLKPKQDVSMVPTITEGRMVINSQMAHGILEHMIFEGQRTPHKASISSHANIMLSGSWEPGHSIHFAKHGGKLWLVDGQHRIAAVAESGRRQEFTVIVHPCRTNDDIVKLYCTFDTNHRNRSASDIIKAAGFDVDLPGNFTNSLWEAAFLVENNFKRMGKLDAESRNVGNRIKIVEKWIDPARIYCSTAKKADQNLRKKLYVSGCIAVGIATFWHQASVANDFWTGVADGDGLRKTDPRHVLAIALRNKSFAGGSNPAAENMCSIAWNAWIKGAKRSIIKIPHDYTLRIAGTPWSKE